MCMWLVIYLVGLLCSPQAGLPWYIPFLDVYRGRARRRLPSGRLSGELIWADSLRDIGRGPRQG